MKIFLSHLFFLVFLTFSFAQINDQDSTVYVKAYWNKDDSHSYVFNSKELKKVQNVIEQEEEFSYQVNINVVDVFEDEKTICWKYDNVKFKSDKFVNNPFSLLDVIQICYVVDKDGRFERYVDLDKTIQTLIFTSEKLQNEYLDNKEVFDQISKIAKQYSTEESIVKIFEKDIKQFHLFYGTGTYKPEITKVEYTSYLDNLFSTSPTPAKTILQLNDIAFSGTNYIMHGFQQADKEWLANSWFNYLKKLAEKLETEQPDESHLNDEIIYNVTTNSRIKDNGWLSFSKEIKKVQFQDTDYTLERRIELMN